MKNFISTVALLGTLVFTPLTTAEIWKDYGLSEEVTELTVVSVKPNYVDAYLTRLKKTWVSSMEIQKDMVVMDYNVWAANVAAQPNVFLTVTYKNMGAMQGSKEGYDALMKAMTERFNADQDEQEELAQGYEDYREIVDYVILNRVEY
jgi:iron uptake system EfeUOB component EfeO/EfeM